MKSSSGLYILILFVLVLLNACKKPENRKCFKSFGEEGEMVHQLDSINQFNLMKGITYYIYQDDRKEIVVRGGENMLNYIELDYDSQEFEMTVNNKNSCNFFRDRSQLMEVEIHYPHYSNFYMEPSDSVFFVDTLTGNHVYIEIRNGGGTAVINTDLGALNVVVSNGSADYILNGHANTAEVKVQGNGFADASQFTSNNYFIYNSSTADLEVNVEGAQAYILMRGTGDVLYTGNADSLTVENKGSGELINF